MHLMVCLLLALITLSVYWQVGNHKFIEFDDGTYITRNPNLGRGLNLDFFSWSLTSTYAANWHPLTWLSHALDIQIFGMEPGGHHLTNVFFHILNTLLLFLVLRRMTNALWQSAFVAALFALHPLHVESVAWVSERKDVLSTFFLMLTLWGYTRFVEHPGTGRYLMVVVFFILGLMAKPMLVTLPFILLLLDYWPLKRFMSDKPATGKLVLEKVPFFILSIISCIITYFAQQSGDAVRSLNHYPLITRIANALVSYVTYTIKMVWPYDLAILYPHPLFLPWWKIAGAGLLLLSVSLLAVRASRRYPYFAVGWLWYLGTLVPVIGLVQVGVQALADRYTYVPLIGLFIIIAWGIPEFFSQLHNRKKVLTITTVILLAFLTATTLLQVRRWASSITIFEHTICKTNNNYVIHNNLGNAFSDIGRLDEAMASYAESLRINPEYPKAYKNMGIILAKQGQLNKAIMHFSQALKAFPGDANVHQNLGLAFAKQGRMDEAIRCFSAVLRINPGNPEAHNNLGAAFMYKGNALEAIKHFQDALRINPYNARAHSNLKKVQEIQRSRP